MVEAFSGLLSKVVEEGKIHVIKIGKRMPQKSYFSW